MFSFLSCCSHGVLFTVETYGGAHLFKVSHLSLIRISLYMVLKPFVLYMPHFTDAHGCQTMASDSLAQEPTNSGKLPGLSLGTVPWVL